MNKCEGAIPKAVLPAVHRIIVIGDIHGDWLALKSALKAAGITDHHNNWIGSDTHVVQVGDFIDRKVRGSMAAQGTRPSRGSGSGDERSESKIIQHLIDLKAKAQQAGGDVHLLLGNHEIMNVYGDFRYVSPMGMTDFGGNRAEAFRPGGRVAKLLACNASAVVQIGSWVFSHAGVTGDVTASYTAEEVNQRIRDYLLGSAGPGTGSGSERLEPELLDLFWHRDYIDDSTCPLARNALSKWKARNMAVGHTVQDRGITSMCNRTLWKVDVGMSNAFGLCYKQDQPCIEVLEILNDGETINVLRGKKAIS